MQLLEQLACGYLEVYGYQNITEQSILTDCASILGYLECADDLVTSGILAESVVLEGIDLKAIGLRIIDFIRGTLEKLHGLLSRAGRFFKNKARAFASKFSKKGKTTPSASSTNQSGSSSNEKSKNTPEDDQSSKDDTPHTKSANASGQSEAPKESEEEPKRSKEEIANDVLKDLPYPGPNAAAIRYSYNDIAYTVHGVYNRAYTVCDAGLGLLKDGLFDMSDESDKNDFEENKEYFKQYEKMLADQGEVMEYLLNWEGHHMKELKGSVKTVADAKKVCALIYDMFLNLESFKCKSDIDYQTYRKYRDEYKFVIKNYAKYYDDLSNAIDSAKNRLPKLLPKLNRLEDSLKSKGRLDPTLSQVVPTVQKLVTMANQVVVNMTASVTEFSAKTDKDLATLSAYFDNVEDKLRSAGVVLD